MLTRTITGMSLHERTEALHSDEVIRIDAGDLSQSDLEAAASEARRTRTRLVISNLLKGRTPEDIYRIAEAGGRQVCISDIHLI